MATCITQLILYDIYPLDKYVLEDTALFVTPGFSLLCLSRFMYGRDKFFLWATGMMLVLFVREIHPPGSSAGVYIGLLALFYIAYKKHHLFADYLRSNYLITMLGTGFFSLLFGRDDRSAILEIYPCRKNISYQARGIFGVARAYTYWLCVVVCRQKVIRK